MFTGDNSSALRKTGFPYGSALI